MTWEVDWKFFPWELFGLHPTYVSRREEEECFCSFYFRIFVLHGLTFVHIFSNNSQTTFITIISYIITSSLSPISATHSFNTVKVVSHWTESSQHTD